MIAYSKRRGCYVTAKQILILKALARRNPDGTPKDIDREFVASFMVFDEMGGKDQGQFYAINGFVFGNLPGLTMKQGEKVRWYLLGMGNEIDLHTPHWHGETVTDGVRNTDVIELLPGSMTTVDMRAQAPVSASATNTAISWPPA